MAIKGPCKGTLPGVQIIGHVPIEISRYLFFAINHGCPFKVRVSEQTPIRSPLVQGGQEIICMVTASWTLAGLRKFRMLIEAQYSVDNNEEDESAAILTDSRRPLEGLNLADEKLENEDQEDTGIIMYQDE